MKRIFGLLALTSIMACTPPRAPRVDHHVRWLVIAPHPDDEALMAGSLIARATAAHETVAVVIVTNGDFGCMEDGLVRENESVRAMTKLGVPESQIHFLGYPDAWLPKLGNRAYWNIRRAVAGRCSDESLTYGARGAKRAWEKEYTRPSMVGEIAELLRDLTPDEVVLPHPEDTHPDHATTYLLFREALDQAGLTRAPRVHRSMVHNGDCWPMSDKPDEPCPDLPVDYPIPTMSLTGRMKGYPTEERMPASDRERVIKLNAIAEYVSQTKTSWDSYLFSYARSDELFFAESYVRSGAKWSRPNDRVLARSVATIPKPAVGALATSIAIEGWRVAIDGLPEATLVRDGAKRQRKTWPLPYDLWWDGQPETFELELHDDGVTKEITLTNRARLLGVAVDLERGK